MKNYTFLLVLSLFTTGLFAQNQNDYVNKFVALPYISVHTVPDSSIFSTKKLPKNTPFLLMFFSPDCDHCHQQTNELLAYKKELNHEEKIKIKKIIYKSELQNKASSLPKYSAAKC